MRGCHAGGAAAARPRPRGLDAAPSIAFRTDSVSCATAPHAADLHEVVVRWPSRGDPARVRYAVAVSVPGPAPSVPGPGPEPADTPAIRAIAGSGVPFSVIRTARPHGPEESARLQGIELGSLLRTIVVRRGADDYVFVLVPAGRRFDWPKLRAHLGVTRLSLPDQEEAKAATGYERGAITPFGASHAWPVVADASIAGLPRVAIGGGAHGVNLHLAAADLVVALAAEVADVTVAEDGPAG